MRMKKEAYWDLLLNLLKCGSYGLLHDDATYNQRPSSSTLGFKFSSNVLYDTSKILISTIVIQNC